MDIKYLVWPLVDLRSKGSRVIDSPEIGWSKVKLRGQVAKSHRGQRSVFPQQPANLKKGL